MTNVLTVPQLLLDANGAEKLIDQGESANVYSVLYDTTGAAFTSTAAILTLTATLSNAADKSVINSRNAQDIKGANGGSIALDADGNVELTLKLQPADNPIVAETDPDQPEEHYLLITWTWTDGALTRTGKHEWLLKVRLKEAVS